MFYLVWHNRTWLEIQSQMWLSVHLFAFIGIFLNEPFEARAWHLSWYFTHAMPHAVFTKVGYEVIIFYFLLDVFCYFIFPERGCFVI